MDIHVNEAFILGFCYSALQSKKVENSLYCRSSIEQSDSRCCGLSVDDVLQCDCWHRPFHTGKTGL